MSQRSRQRRHLPLPPPTGHAPPSPVIAAAPVFLVSKHAGAPNLVAEAGGVTQAAWLRPRVGAGRRRAGHDRGRRRGLRGGSRRGRAGHRSRWGRRRRNGSRGRRAPDGRGRRWALDSRRRAGWRRPGRRAGRAARRRGRGALHQSWRGSWRGRLGGLGRRRRPGRGRLSGLGRRRRRRGCGRCRSRAHNVLWPVAGTHSLLWRRRGAREEGRLRRLLAALCRAPPDAASRRHSRASNRLPHPQPPYDSR